MRVPTAEQNRTEQNRTEQNTYSTVMMRVKKVKPANAPRYKLPDIYFHM